MSVIMTKLSLKMCIFNIPTTSLLLPQHKVGHVQKWA